MSPGRPIASCLALLAIGSAMLGCGSGDPVKVDIPSETVTAINSKLDEVQKRFEAGKCTGGGSAESSLDALRAAVNGLEVDQQFIDDMNEMLDNLGTQIADQCQKPDRTTTATATTDTLPTTTTPTTTDTAPTTTETTTKETTTTTTTTEQTTTGQTSTTPGDGNPNGGGPGGGVSPGGGKKQKPPKGKGGKPKPGGGVKAGSGATGNKEPKR